jgi:hypothetical protein
LSSKAYFKCGGSLISEASSENGRYRCPELGGCGERSVGYGGSERSWTKTGQVTVLLEFFSRSRNLSRALAGKTLSEFEKKSASSMRLMIMTAIAETALYYHYTCCALSLYIVYWN